MRATPVGKTNANGSLLNRTRPAHALAKLAAVAAIALLACARVSASFFYRNEPSTKLVASYGFDVGGEAYFLLKISIYRQAKGLAAFPDGGRPKLLVEKVYLFETGDSGSRKLAELPLPHRSADLYFQSSKIRAGGSGLLIKVPWYDKKAQEEKSEYFSYGAAVPAVSACGDPGGDWPKSSMTLTETNRPFRDFSDFDGAGLPNPLDYTPGADNPKGLARLIARGMGERLLRRAAARRLAAAGNIDLLRQAIAGLDKIAASRKIYFWEKEKALLDKILEAAAKKDE